MNNTSTIFIIDGNSVVSVEASKFHNVHPYSFKMADLDSNSSTMTGEISSISGEGNAFLFLRFGLDLTPIGEAEGELRAADRSCMVL